MRCGLVYVISFIWHSHSVGCFVIHKLTALWKGVYAMRKKRLGFVAMEGNVFPKEIDALHWLERKEGVE